MPFSYAKDGFGKRQRLWISSCFFAVMEAFSHMLETEVVAEDLVGRQFLDSMCLVLLLSMTHFYYPVLRGSSGNSEVSFIAFKAVSGGVNLSKNVLRMVNLVGTLRCWVDSLLTSYWA